jgi:ubiquinone/menaquinone biosynthesis C-methylase UbiE
MTTTSVSGARGADKSKVPSAFDRIASTYDLLTGMNPGYLKHLRWSAERLRAPSDGNILDLCCGTGLSTEALVLTYPRARFVGLDASAGMLEKARHKASLAKVEFVLGDATDPAAAGVTGTFDAILMARSAASTTSLRCCVRAALFVFMSIPSPTANALGSSGTSSRVP